MIVFGIFALDNIIIMTKIERKQEISQKKGKFNSRVSRNLFDIYRRFFQAGSKPTRNFEAKASPRCEHVIFAEKCACINYFAF